MVRSVLGGVDNDRLHILRADVDDHGSLFGVAKTQMLLQGEIMTYEEVKLEALQVAIKALGQGARVEQIIETAKQFEQYIRHRGS